MALDMTTIARFLVLPGAEQLVEAFSRIPPGPLRDSVVSHAQVIADTYSAAPADQRMPDPLLMAASAPAPALAPPAPPPEPQREPSVARTPLEEAVRLRLQTTLAEHEIAERVGLPLGEVVQELRRAREAGVKFAAIERPKAKKQTAGIPGKTFPMSVSELDGMGRGGALAAATARGLTIEGYMERRKLAIDMAIGGHDLQEIVEATGEEEAPLRGWFSLARNAGHPVPYVPNYNPHARSLRAAEQEAAEAPAPIAQDDGPRYDLAEDEDDDTVIVEPVAEAPAEPQTGAWNMARPQTRVWPVPYDQMHWMEQKNLRAAAKADGKTVEEIIARHKLITDALLAGRYPVQLEEDHGFPGHVIRTTINTAERYGVVFPPRKKGSGASKAMGRPMHIDRLVAAARAKREAEVAPAADWPPAYEAMSPRAQAVTRQSAETAGLSIEQYQERQRTIVRRRMAGEYPQAIADDLKVGRHTVSHVVDTAKKAGMVFPVVATGSGARKAMGRPYYPPNRAEHEPPPPKNIRFWTTVTELDPRSLAKAEGAAKALGLDLQGYAALRRQALELFRKDVSVAEVAKQLGLGLKQADNWRDRARTNGLLPSGPTGRVTFPMFEDELSASGLPQILKAAERMGATLEGYMALRRSAVAMFIRGMTPPDVAAELGLDVKTMSNWHFMSRAAGRQVVGTPDQASEAAPRVAAAPEPPAPLAPPTTDAARTPPDPAPTRSPAAAEVSPRGFWTEVSEVPERGRAMAEQAARDMGLTFEQYAAVRRRAVELFRKGFFPANVASELNLTHKQASNWRDRMKGAGLLNFAAGPTIANDTPDEGEHERLEA